MSAEKVVLRAQMRARRQTVGQRDAHAAAREVASKIVAMDAFHAANCVALFSPFRCELDPTLVVEHSGAAGKLFCLPRSHRAIGRLSFHEVQTPPGVTAQRWSQQLSVGEYGILEPSGPELPLTCLELVVVPALAFDRAGYRLGWGAGYYDRLLAQLGANTTTVVVGYDWQCIDQLPRDPHDVAVQWVITPSEALPIT